MGGGRSFTLFADVWGTMLPATPDGVLSGR